MRITSLVQKFSYKEEIDRLKEDLKESRVAIRLALAARHIKFPPHMPGCKECEEFEAALNEFNKVCPQ